MATKEKTLITVRTTVRSTLYKTWTAWTQPEHILNWNAASDDWQTTDAKNTLRKKGKFSYRMEAKDGSAGFDYSGSYLEIKPFELLHFQLDDGREVRVEFETTEEGTQVTEHFEAEDQNSRDLQKQGWQAILDRFKSYTEGI